MTTVMFPFHTVCIRPFSFNAVLDGFAYNIEVTWNITAWHNGSTYINVLYEFGSFHGLLRFR